MKDINSRIEKVELELLNLMEKKSTLDERIKTKEDELDKLKAIKKQKKFDEFSDVLKSKGLSIDEILKAVENNNFSVLQNKSDQ